MAENRTPNRSYRNLRPSSIQTNFTNRTPLERQTARRRLNFTTNVENNGLSFAERQQRIQSTASNVYINNSNGKNK